MNMNYLVISLPGHERRGYIKGEFEKIGESFEFIDAISGQELEESGLFPTIPVNYWMGTRPKSWRMFALHLSWLKAIQYAKKQNYEKFIICEDDCVFLEGYTEKIERLLSEIPEEWDIINLGARESTSTQSIEGKTYLSKITKGLSGMQSLLLNRNCDKVIYLLLKNFNWTTIMSNNISIFKYAVTVPFSIQNPSLPSIVRQD